MIKNNTYPSFWFCHVYHQQYFQNSGASGKPQKEELQLNSTSKKLKPSLSCRASWIVEEINLVQRASASCNSFLIHLIDYSCYGCTELIIGPERREVVLTNYRSLNCIVSSHSVWYRLLDVGYSLWLRISMRMKWKKKEVHWQTTIGQNVTGNAISGIVSTHPKF